MVFFWRITMMMMGADDEKTRDRGKVTAYGRQQVVGLKEDTVVYDQSSELPRIHAEREEDIGSLLGKMRKQTSA